MELNGMNIGGQLVITFIALALFGTLYNFSIEKFPWLAQRRSAEQVVIGVGVTVLASGFMIGWMDVSVLFILFVASGSPMLIGSWMRAAHDDHEAKQITKEQLQK